MYKLLISMLFIVGCGVEEGGSSSLSLGESFVRWKAVLMTGDDSISAFDNARKKVGDVLRYEGLEEDHILHLSRDSRQGVRASSVANFRQAFQDHNLGTFDGCFSFITSHGSQSSFYIKGQSGLTPTEYNKILTDTCADKPTVVLVSACYSGIFSQPVMQKPNRIILTAASKDRTSFGCTAEATYTYWDGCLIDSLSKPELKTWGDMYSDITECIKIKEDRANVTPSLPQVFLGEDIKNFPVFNRF